MAKCKHTHIVLGDLKTLNDYNENHKNDIQPEDCIFTKDIEVLRDCVIINNKLIIIK